MIDRRVEVVHPKPKESERGKISYFSEFLGEKNIVLLGDPGSGKTYLFNSFSESEQVNVRSFLRRPAAQFIGCELFINGLDEKRTGRNDTDIFDEVIKKLFECQPQKVRISCRERDWLGETDLAAFDDYFGQHGEVTVLRLCGLTNDEQLHVLASNTEIQIPDPALFLTTASEKKLTELLLNPQNLIMLAKVVDGGAWPKTRRELFQKATDILLKEHNVDKKIQHYSLGELQEAAGVLCAARLISDIDGISLTPHEQSEDTGYFGEINFIDASQLESAISRRVFINKSNNTVDYVHRTIAEYLAASWLAKKIRHHGLPVNRVLKLLGIDDVPSSELKGVYAWLPVLLPEYGEIFIQNDPFTVALYGDASELTNQNKRVLLKSLEALAARDPFFYAKYRTKNFSSILNSELAKEIKELLLRVRSVNLRILLLDILSCGEPIAELKAVYVAILRSEYHYLAEKEAALDCLLRLSRNPIVLSYIYRNIPQPETEDGIVLRSNFIASSYSYAFYADDIYRLIRSVLGCKDKLPIGSLWHLATNILSAHDIEEVFQHLEPLGSIELKNNLNEINYILDGWLVKYLANQKPALAKKVWPILQTITTFQEQGYSRDREKVRRIFLQSPLLLEQLIQEAVSNYNPCFFEKAYYGMINNIVMALANAPSEEQIYSAICEQLFDNNNTEELDILLYEAAWSLTKTTVRLAQRFADDLLELPSSKPWLSKLSEGNSVCKIPTYHYKSIHDRESREQGALRTQQKNAASLLDVQHKLLSGNAPKIMGWLGNVYFNRFASGVTNQDPLEHLASKIDQTGLPIATAAIRSFLTSNRFPQWPEIKSCILQHRFYEEWLTAVASVDLYYREHSALPHLSCAKKQALFAIYAFLRGWFNFPSADDGTAWWPYFFKQNKDSALDVYLELLYCTIDKPERAIGLHELIYEQEFEQDRYTIIHQILRTHSDIETSRLEELVCVLIKESDFNVQLSKTANESLAGVLSQKNREFWTLVDYFFCSGQSKIDLSSISKNNVKLVRSLLACEQGSRGALHAVDTSKVVEIIEIAAKFYQNTYDFKAESAFLSWDGAQFIRTLITELALRADECSIAHLEGLLTNTILESYADHTKHALAESKTRFRDISFDRPNWQQTLSVLENHVPINAADLWALLADQLESVSKRISNSSNDLYKQFWNEDKYNKTTKPKGEESARDALFELVHTSLILKGVNIEPEGHMAHDKRADLLAIFRDIRIPIELKRDYHSELWTAVENQLHRLYTKDPRCGGYGVFVVFWYGDKRGCNITTHPKKTPDAKTAMELKNQLASYISAENKQKTYVAVLDVSGAY